MLIKNLEKMEKIVSKNHNLMWDGWDVLEIKKSDAARTSVEGMRINGKWFLYKRYTPNNNGWNISDRYRN